MFASRATFHLVNRGIIAGTKGHPARRKGGRRNASLPSLNGKSLRVVKSGHVSQTTRPSRFEQVPDRALRPSLRRPSPWPGRSPSAAATKAPMRERGDQIQKHLENGGNCDTIKQANLKGVAELGASDEAGARQAAGPGGPAQHCTRGEAPWPSITLRVIGHLGFARARRRPAVRAAKQAQDCARQKANMRGLQRQKKTEVKLLLPLVGGCSLRVTFLLSRALADLVARALRACGAARWVSVQGKTESINQQHSWLDMIIPANAHRAVFDFLREELRPKRAAMSRSGCCDGVKFTKFRVPRNQNMVGVCFWFL